MSRIFSRGLEDKLGFKVELVQTDNEIEFVNDQAILIIKSVVSSYRLSNTLFEFFYLNRHYYNKEDNSNL